MGHVPALDRRSVHESWHLADVPPGERDEIWRSLVSDTHLPWTLDRQARDDPADQPPDHRGRDCIERWALGDVDLVTCRAGACGGRRRRAEQRATDGEFVAILLVRSGHELIRSPAGDFLLGPGDVLAWDSARPLEFDVAAGLHKQTLLIPLPRFRELARRPELVTYRNLGAAPGAPLLCHYLDLVTQAELTGESAAAAGNAALELLGAVTAGSRGASCPAGHSVLRSQAKQFIEAHLGERELAPDRVAREIAVSPRLLYLLFEEEGDAVHAYIRRRRLAHVHARLARPGPRPTVAQLAARWGFADGDALGRAFRSQYGITPGQAAEIGPEGDRAEQAGRRAGGAVPREPPHS